MLKVSKTKPSLTTLAWGLLFKTGDNLSVIKAKQFPCPNNPKTCQNIVFDEQKSWEIQKSIMLNSKMQNLTFSYFLILPTKYPFIPIHQTPSLCDTKKLKHIFSSFSLYDIKKLKIHSLIFLAFTCLLHL